MNGVWQAAALVFVAVVVSKLLARKTGVVDVLWLILAGSLLGNAGLLPADSKPLEFLGELGILFIMFALGFDERLSHFVRGVKKSLGIAVIGAIGPFCAGYITAQLLGYSGNASVIWGLAMTATAVSLTMMSLQARGLHKSVAATGIMTAALTDDVLSLIGLAIIIPLVVAGAGSSNAELISESVLVLFKVLVFFGTIGFVGLVLFPGKNAPKRQEAGDFRYRVQVWVSRVSIKPLLLLDNAILSPLVVTAIAVLLGVLAHELGFHLAIGAYFAGLFLSDHYFVRKHDLSRTALERTRRYVSNMAYVVFGPIFFVGLGSKLLFDGGAIVDVLPVALALFAVVAVVQVLAAGLAARFTGNYHWHESVLIGLGMLGRAELCFIVLNIAYVQHAIIDQVQFNILMCATFLLNITIPLVVTWWSPYYQGKRQLRLFGLVLSQPPDSSPQLSRLDELFHRTRLGDVFAFESVARSQVRAAGQEPGRVLNYLKEHQSEGTTTKKY